MALYRVIKKTPLSTGHTYGDLVDGGRFKPATLQALVMGGVLAKASSPPLAQLPGWERRAERLADAGIVTVEQLMEADVAQLAATLGLKTTRGLERWMEEARASLSVKGSAKPGK